jgi:predicted RNase H-like HicB family nuclease
MKYTVILTEDNKGNYFAKVPSIPDCSAKAKSRNEVINNIRAAIANIINKSEIIQLDVPATPKSNALQSETPWEFFGAFKEIPDWGILFEEIENQRDLN